MQTAVLQVLFWSLAIQQSLAAVTWRTIGCDGWNFQGKSIDDIWDNAVAMTEKAQSQIDIIPTQGQVSSYTTAQKYAGANAKFMFGVNFFNRVGLFDAGVDTMNKAKAMYSDVQQTLLGTKSNLDYSTAFLFCSSNGMVKTPVPFDGPEGSEQNIWHAEIKDGDQTEYLTLSFVTVSSRWKPCQEVGEDNIYLGKTFSAKHLVNGQSKDFIGVILCPEQWANMKQKPTVFATLDDGYGAVARGKNKYPYPGHYNSVSGTLVHEMVHVQAHLINPDLKYTDEATGFRECNLFAKKTSTGVLTNPDNYRVFAEMNMSPNTRWGLYNPKLDPTATTAADAAQTPAS